MLRALRPQIKAWTAVSFPHIAKKGIPNEVRNGFRGLRARGGFGVDIAWVDGRLESATISGKPGTRSVVRYAGAEVVLDMGSSGSCTVVLEGSALKTRGLSGT